MRGRECLTDVQIGQRGQVAHQTGLCLLLEGQLDVIDEAGHFLCQIADVVQKKDFACLAPPIAES